MAISHHKSQEIPKASFIDVEKSAPCRSELAKLAFRCQKITTEIEHQIDPHHEQISYSHLEAQTDELAESVKEIHEKDPTSVDYESWMLLLRLPTILSENDSVRSRRVGRKSWKVARQTVSGLEMLKDDPELQKILEKRKPIPYDQIIQEVFYSDPHFAGQTLDDNYSSSKSNPDTQGQTEPFQPTVEYNELETQQVA